MSWKIVKLDDICNVITCGVAKRPEYQDSGIPFLSSLNVKENRFILSSFKYISEKDHEQLTKYSKPEKGDILYTRVGSFGEAAVIDINFEFSVFVSLTLIKPKHELVDSRFLMWHLNSPDVKSFANNNTSGIGVQNLNVGVVRKFQIPLPPLPIQKRIAEILDVADALKRKDQELLKKYDELAQTIFIDMFGDPVKNEKGWEVKSLSEVCLKIADIDHNMPKEDENGLPFISAKDLKDDGTISFENVKKISIDDFNRLSRKIKPEFNDIIYSRIGAKLGKARKVKTDIPFLVSYSCCTIKPNTALVNTDFLCYFLDSSFCLNEVLKKVRSIGVPDLGMDEVREIKVLFPPKKLQEEFCKAVYKLELSCNNLRKELSRELFNSLIQKAFKGELVTE
jgi:type I restriction enzyme S subunit